MNNNNRIVFRISPKLYDAVIFDLDGVVTRTARIHAAAWKRLFDEYLARRAARLGEEFRPFEIATDYRWYVDGKPRYDGVKSFLNSRSISLPYGSPEDSPDQETVCGLGNSKNRLFTELLKEIGVDVYESTIALIRELRAANIKTAIVTSSKNCTAVLDAAGISRLFDARVDGNEKERRHLKGKPHPDIFLEAARQLEVDPSRAIVVEDAIAGVEAGSRGKFGCVIGVDRGGLADSLLERGANLVVGDLAQVVFGDKASGLVADAAGLPSALGRLEEISAFVGNRRLALFLDYDGTLTPIVSHPEDALLSEAMRFVLRLLADRCTVAIVSGRDLRDVQGLVGIEEVFYAGSHGFEITGPKGWGLKSQQGREFLPLLDQAERELHGYLEKIPGAVIERKRFSIAVHYRLVGADDISTVAETVDRVAADHRELRKGHGKKVFELQPRIDWHKGKAVLRLLEEVTTKPNEVVPLYIGDDLTDEDVFQVLEDRGIGIIVREGSRPTAARYALENPGEVHLFLEALTSSTLAGVTW
jgi:trehalose 6-phosphate phosphatase